MTKPKGVRVTVERWRGLIGIPGNSGYATCGVPGERDPMMDRTICYKVLRKAGVPALKPGESVTGRMVFVPDKKKGAKK